MDRTPVASVSVLSGDWVFRKEDGGGVGGWVGGGVEWGTWGMLEVEVEGVGEAAEGLFDPASSPHGAPCTRAPAAVQV